MRRNIIDVFYNGNSMTEETRGQCQHLAYRIRVPGQPPVDYGPDEFQKAEEHYLRVKDAGGNWYEIQRDFDGVVRENDMIR